MSIESHIQSAISDIIGHDSPKQVLSKLIENNRVPHALLFSGPSSIGKWTLARNFASALFSKQAPLSQQQIKAIRDGVFADLHLVSHQEGTKDISVEKIREVRDSLNLAAYYGGYKVAIIDDAHKMSLAASNALLKTLEEPAANTVIILVSDSANRIPTTIVSRCQKVFFSFLEQKESQALCNNISKELGLDEKHSKALSSLASGSLEMLSLKQFISEQSKLWVDEKEAKLHLESLLLLYKSVRESLSNCHADNAISTSSSLLADKDKRETTFRMILATLRDNLRNAQSNEVNKYATAIENFSELERLVFERNANPENQLSSFLLAL